jgi:hypothetical protein
MTAQVALRGLGRLSTPAGLRGLPLRVHLSLRVHPRYLRRPLTQVALLGLRGLPPRVHLSLRVRPRYLRRPLTQVALRGLGRLSTPAGLRGLPLPSGQQARKALGY